jgi:hypothetical protein
VKMRTKLGAMIGAGALAFAMFGTALAAEGNQTNQQWNAADSVCTGGPDGDFTVDAGQVAWVFVHTGVTGPGHLTANFDSAGAQGADSYQTNGVGVLKYWIITDAPDELLNFSDNLDGGVLNLSHTCYNSEETSESTSFTDTVSDTTDTESSSSSSTASFSQTVSDTTDESLPNTATIGSTDSSGLSGGFWMLVAGIGALGGSVLVLLPARAKNRK